MVRRVILPSLSDRPWKRWAEFRGEGLQPFQREGCVVGAGATAGRIVGGAAMGSGNRCNRPTAHLHPQQLIDQDLGFAETQREGTAQQTHQGTEPGAETAGLPISWQQGAGAGGTAGADPAMQTVHVHQQRDRWDLQHLMAHGRWILSLQQGSACGPCPCAAPVTETQGRRWREAWRSCASCGRTDPAGWPVRWPGR